ncbi:MAG: hypothetical protein ACLQMO_15495 [Acidobacteriaceae bacterium]
MRSANLNGRGLSTRAVGWLTSHDRKTISGYLAAPSSRPVYGPRAGAQSKLGVPRIYSFNETERAGCITKQGNKLAQTVLVQCALTTKHYSLFVPQQFCQRIQRGGGLANIALRVNSGESFIALSKTTGV